MKHVMALVLSVALVGATAGATFAQTGTGGGGGGGTGTKSTTTTTSPTTTKTTSPTTTQQTTTTKQKAEEDEEGCPKTSRGEARKHNPHCKD
jgi:hypothetical protein